MHLLLHLIEEGASLHQDLRPRHRHPFDPLWEKELSRLSMFELRDRLFKYVTERVPMYGIPLCINTNSATYGEFVK